MHTKTLQDKLKVAMSAWLLPIFFFAVWGLWIMASASQVFAEDIRRGTPKESRRGVSILPGFPLFPLFFWAAALLVNNWFAPWGTIVIGGFHVFLALLFIITIARASIFSRSHEAGD